MLRARTRRRRQQLRTQKPMQRAFPSWLFPLRLQRFLCFSLLDLVGELQPRLGGFHKTLAQCWISCCFNHLLLGFVSALGRGQNGHGSSLSGRPANIAGPQLSLTGAFNVESQALALPHVVWIDARGLQRADVKKYIRAPGVVSDETEAAVGIPHFQGSGSHRSISPSPSRS